MKKLICTILLGTALVGSGAWAATDVAVAPSGRMGEIKASSKIQIPSMPAASSPIENSHDEVELPAIELKYLQLNRLLKQYPKPNYLDMVRPFDPYLLIPEIEYLQGVYDKVIEENRNDFTPKELETVHSIQQRVTEKVHEWFLDHYKPAYERQEVAMKKWSTEHPDITALERELGKLSRSDGKWFE